MAKPVFKQYSQHQAILFPPSLDELVEANHPSRIVSCIIDGLNLSPLLKLYEGGGTSSYHPAMLLKVVVYCYLVNIYSSRKMEQALKENIHLMWLSGMQQPDHNTLNRFRSQRLKESLKDIFVQIVELLAKEGLVSIKELYVDGTKMEACANRYTFVWGNAIKTNKEKMKAQLDELWSYAQKIAADELDMPEPPEFTPADPENVKQTIEKISNVLQSKQAAKKMIQKAKYAAKKWHVNLTKYNEQEKILDGRNSYSKTDPDATFMRMKEDHMRNGQLKPAYNLQISTNNQFIVNYSIHQTTADTLTLALHLEEHLRCYGSAPETVVADAGYGSEQNYELLEKMEVESFVKYNYFDRQQSERLKNKVPFSPDQLYYNQEQDVYYCPMGQPMQNIGESVKKTTAGFSQRITKYRAINCEGCPLRGACHKSQNNRIIEVNHNLNRHKARQKEKLNSELGIYHRKKRPVDVEPVFGNLKQNHSFRRFMLRGREKVSIEVGLLAIAQNIRKKMA